MNYKNYTPEGKNSQLTEPSWGTFKILLLEYNNQEPDEGIAEAESKQVGRLG